MHETVQSVDPHVSTKTKLRVTVLRGGPGGEREISLQSGGAIAAALRRRGHDVREADISPTDLSALDESADVVFPALHGEFGEDGQLQRELEARRIRFVGSGSAASALAMDKIASKERVLALGLMTPEFCVITPDNLSATPPIATPLVVKPNEGGSSVSTFIVTRSEDYEPAARDVVARFGRALVESFISGDELTVGIVGERVLPVICVRPKRAFYDYQAKYQDDATEYLFEAGHAQATLQAVQAESMRVFAALGCRHLARVDWMVDAAGQRWFLELNSLPGFTSHSLVPKAAEKVGVSFDELVEQLVQMAWKEPL